MLQQTQVKTVIPYFEKFTKKIKTLKKLSSTSERKVLKLWEGLGYYKRAKNLISTAKIIVKQKKLALPKTLNEIKKLPGIGEYTGNILLALIYNQPRLALDGNVKRVFSRILNKHEKKIDYDKILQKNKKKLLYSNRNSDLAEAMMEFGALICRPQEPYCSICPVNKICKYYKSGASTKLREKNKINKKSYNIFCYLNKRKQIALTKKNNLGFLKEYHLPIVKENPTNINLKVGIFCVNIKTLFLIKN